MKLKKPFLLTVLAFLAVSQSFRFPSRTPGLPQLMGMKLRTLVLKRRPAINPHGFLSHYVNGLDVNRANDAALEMDLQKIINAFHAMINQKPLHQRNQQPLHQRRRIPPPLKVPMITGNYVWH